MIIRWSMISSPNALMNEVSSFLDHPCDIVIGQNVYVKNRHGPASPACGWLSVGSFWRWRRARRLAWLFCTFKFWGMSLEYKKPVVLWGRIASNVEPSFDPNSTADVYLDPVEREAVQVKLSSLIPLNDKMKSVLECRERVIFFRNWYCS